MDSQHGFIHEKFDIKILVLFVLNRLAAPVTLEELSELTLFDGGISYFDFAECVADMVSTGHIEQKDGKYSITEKGARNGRITESSLPFSVRSRAEEDTSRAAAAQRRDSMIHTSSFPSEGGGHIARLALNDGGGTILDMTILAGTEAQAAKMQKNFRDRAEDVYKAIAALLLEEGKKQEEITGN